jgi:hypothetical protein
MIIILICNNFTEICIYVADRPHFYARFKR